TKLKELNKQFNIPTVRKPPPVSVATTLICDKLDDDVNKTNGPDAMKTFLALDGYQIPRDTVRQIMKDNAPGTSKQRYPGNKDKIIRTNLTAQGVFQELHCDGHEKLATAALRMGPVGISIYGFRDKASGLLCGLVAVPDARHSAVVGHLYLDLLEEFGVFPMQVTVDDGSETGFIYAIQSAIRKILTPNVDTRTWPVFMALKSVNNIPIENLWKWLVKTIGRNLRDLIEDGKTNGLFNASSELHIHLFHWLWSKIIQIKLDEFKLYWNYHTPRKNPKKVMISGAPPLEIFRNPANYGLEFLGKEIDQDAINALRETIPSSRDEALRWVPQEFDDAAQEAYEQIGSPKLEARRGWVIFGQMAELISWAEEDS
ncbi:hypothetical protein FB45DRAFT_745629, partial [Roridomyces roridus]